MSILNDSINNVNNFNNRFADHDFDDYSDFFDCYKDIIVGLADNNASDLLRYMELYLLLLKFDDINEFIKYFEEFYGDETMASYPLFVCFVCCHHNAMKSKFNKEDVYQYVEKQYQIGIEKKNKYAMLLYGKHLYEAKQDHEGFHKYCDMAIEHNNICAYFYKGRFYESEYEKTKDKELQAKFILYYNEGIKHSCINCMNELGCYYLRKHQNSEILNDFFKQGLFLDGYSFTSLNNMLVYFCKAAADKNDYIALSNIGYIMGYYMEEKVKSVVYFEKALSIAKKKYKINAFHNLINAYIHSKEYTTALSTIYKAMRYDIDNKHTMLFKTLERDVLILMKDYKKAFDVLEYLCNNGCVDSMIKYGDLLCMNYDEVKFDFVDFDNKYYMPNVGVLKVKCICCEDHCKVIKPEYEKAHEYYKKAYDKNALLAYYRLGRLYELYCNDRVIAIQYYTISDDFTLHETVVSHCKAAIILAKLKKQNAKQAIQKIIDANVTYTDEINYLFGEYYEAMNDFDKACEYYSKCIDNNYEEAFINMSNMLLLQDKIEDSMKYLIRTIKIHGNFNAYLCLVNIHTIHYKDAKKIIALSNDLEKYCDKIFLIIPFLYESANDNSKMIECYKKSIEKEGVYKHHAANNYCKYLMEKDKNKNHDKVLFELLSDATKNNNVPSMLTFGNYYKNKNDHKNAEHYYCMGLENGSIECFYKMMEMYEQDEKKSIEICEKYYKKYDDVLLHYFKRCIDGCYKEKCCEIYNFVVSKHIFRYRKNLYNLYNSSVIDMI